MNKLLLVLIVDFVLTILAVSTRTTALSSSATGAVTNEVTLSSLRK